MHLADRMLKRWSIGLSSLMVTLLEQSAKHSMESVCKTQKRHLFKEREHVTVMNKSASSLQLFIYRYI